MEHLQRIMGEDYSEANVRVRLFDNILQVMYSDKIEADTCGFFWGKPYEILIKKCLTGTPPTAIPFHTGRRMSSYQFSMLVIVKVQVAEHRRTIAKAKRAKPVNLCRIESPPSIEDEYH